MKNMKNHNLIIAQHDDIIKRGIIKMFKKSLIKPISALSVILVCIALILIALPKTQSTPELTNTTRLGGLEFESPETFKLASKKTALPSAPPRRDLRFGAVQTYETPAVATAMGASWTRVYLPWSELQPNGPDDWNEHYFTDDVLSRELNAGRQPVGLLINTPTWAGGDPRNVPNGLYLPVDDPNNHWGQFVKRIVQRYQGRIDHWIIWNEPDIWSNNEGTQAWNGSLEDYVQLLKVAYQAAKSVNNRAVIGAAATTYWWDKHYSRELYLTRMLEAIQQDPDAAANNGFFDFVGLNLYYDSEQIYDIIGIYRQELNRYGFANKQVWLTETNAPPSSDPLYPVSGRYNITLEEQSYFMVQAWVMSIASGAARIEFYKMNDGNMPPYGIQRTDNSLRPVFWSYRTVATYLSDFQYATLTKEGQIRRVVVSRGQQGTTTVVWNKGLQAQTVNVAATANSALLVDPFGSLGPIYPQNGQYTLNLPAGQGELVGGRPFMIVEGAGAQVSLERPDDIPVVPLVYDPVISNQPPTPEPEPTASPTPLPSTQPGLADWDIPNEHFFTQTAHGQGGFSVVNDEYARLWEAFQRLGGLETVGYPISQRYIDDGFVTQAFQKLILQWRPEENKASPIPLFDELSERNLDQRLKDMYQIPVALPSGEIEPPNASSIDKRRALLAYNRAIEARYLKQSDVFGLPTSQVEDMGNHDVIRTQSAVFQQWKIKVPWANEGEVTIVNGGDIAKQLGLLPTKSLQPEAVGR